MRFATAVLREFLYTKGDSHIPGDQHETLRTVSKFSRSDLSVLQLKSSFLTVKLQDAKDKDFADFGTYPEQSYFVPYEGKVLNELWGSFPDLPKHISASLYERIKRTSESYAADLNHFFSTQRLTQEEIDALMSDLNFAKQQHEFKLGGATATGHDMYFTYTTMYAELISFNLVPGDVVWLIGAGSGEEALTWCVRRAERSTNNMPRVLC